MNTNDKYNNSDISSSHDAGSDGPFSLGECCPSLRRNIVPSYLRIKMKAMCVPSTRRELLKKA
jgi:hypothetical protein